MAYVAWKGLKFRNTGG